MESALHETFFSHVREACMKQGIAHEWRWICQHLLEKPTSDRSLIEQADQILARRNNDEPLAYIFGSWAFRSFEFNVGPGVLIPRPETEELVENALTQIEDHWSQGKDDFVIYDFGAGSGCAGLALAYELVKRNLTLNLTGATRKVHLKLVENSGEALQYLRMNVELFLDPTHMKKFFNVETALIGHALAIDIIAKDWLQIQPEPVDLIISNPPYLSEGEWNFVDGSVRSYEPKLALVPERDTAAALSPYRELIQFANANLNGGGTALFEMGTLQPSRVSEISTWADPDCVVSLIKDMSEKDRFLMIKKNQVLNG